MGVASKEVTVKAGSAGFPGWEGYMEGTVYLLLTIDTERQTNENEYSLYFFSYVPG